jgi:hypothetical protein
VYPKPTQQIKPKEQPINIQSKTPELLQSPNTLELETIPFKKGTYFTRDRQNQEEGSKQFGRKGAKGYFDKTTGRLMGTYQEGGSVWEIIN